MLQTLWFSLHVVGTLFSIALLFSIVQRKSTQYTNYFLFTCICASISLVARCLYIQAPDLYSLLFTAKMEYIGKCYANFFALLFILSFRDIYWPSWIKKGLFFINSVACVLILSAEHHTHYYSSISTKSSPVGITLDVGKTPFYYFYMVFVLLEMILFIYLSIQGLRQRLACHDAISATAFVYLTASGSVPMLLLGLQTAGIIHGIDMVPLGILGSVIFSVFAIFKYDLFHIVDEAKDYVLETINEGVLVVDQQMHILYANPYMEPLRHEPALLEFLHKDRLERNINKTGVSIRLRKKIYDVSVSSLSKARKVEGYIIVFVDITDVITQTQLMKDLKDKAEEANLAKSLFISNMSHEIRTPMNAIVNMTEILLRDDFTPVQTEYLQNIQTSGDSLLCIINDILDFSKMETGKFELLEAEYEPQTLLGDLGIIFLTRIGDSDIELLFDIDKKLPAKLYGDAGRLRQLIINIVNNGIKYTDSGFVRLKVSVKQIVGNRIQLEFSVKDSGIGIRKEDLSKLFDSFQRVDTKKNAHKEGTGLGLAISKQLVELMGGELLVDSVYGEGSDFHFVIWQQLVDADRTPATMINDENTSVTIGAMLEKEENQIHLQALTKSFGLTFIDFQKTPDVPVDYLFTERCLIDQVMSHLRKDTKLCILQNPTQDYSQSGDFITVNKPLYSANFCSIINQDTTEKSTSRTTEISFIAPKARILIVDDNKMNLRVAEGLLKPLRMQMDFVETGEASINMVKENHYDIVFMDHMMPGMDGTEATRAIRMMKEKNPYFQELPIIALTANAIVGAKEEFLLAGMNDYISKPIIISELLSVVRKWLPEDYIEEIETT